MNKLMHGVFGSGLTAAVWSGQLGYVVTVVVAAVVAMFVILIFTLWKLPRDRLDWVRGMCGPRGG